MRKVILTATLLLAALAMPAQSIKSFVSKQLKTYPASRLIDIYKSCFQDFMGAEHLVSDTASVREYLDYELSTTSLNDLSPVLYEPCGIKGNYVRVSLRAVKEGLIPEEKLLDAFIRSANGVKRPSVDSWKNKWRKITDTVESMDVKLPHYDEDKQYIDSVLSVGKYAISHSQDFRDAYNPHYRIVSRKIFKAELLPSIKKAKGNTRNKHN